MRRATSTADRHRRTISWAGRSVAAAAVAALTLAGVVPANAVAADPLSTYIVDASSLGALRAAVALLADSRTDVLPEVGNAIVELTAADAKRLDAIPGITVAADQMLSVTDAQDSAPWGLDRLDQSTPSVGKAAGQYWYPGSAGAGVRVYIVDSGLWMDHPDFTGRVIDGYDAIQNIEGPLDDCNGHGTAVASAAAGTLYGVAKRASVVPIKVANCQGQASTSAIIRGLDWIAATHPAGTPASINISMGALDKDGGGGFAAMEDAVASIVAKGYFVTIAAGNDGNGSTVPEACQFSPARTPTAFTTGAADAWTGAVGVEGRATFSNAGSCIDAFAPGVNIMTASMEGEADRERNGTSFASPIVAGIAALHLADHTTDTPKQTTDAILAAAQKDALVDTPTRGLSSTIHYASSYAYSTVITPSPNLLVRTTAQVPSSDGVVTGFTSPAGTTTSLKLAWSAPATGVRLTLEGGGKPASFVDVTGTSYTFTGLTDATGYRVTATTVTDGLTGAAAVTVNATTGPPLRVTPAGVQALTATLVPASTTVGPKVLLAWAVPTDLGATPTTDYFIQVSKNGGAWATYPDGVSVARAFTTPPLTASTAYGFRVFARNSGGTGTATNVTYTTSRVTPSAARTLTATLVPATTTVGPRTTLAWTAPADQGFTAITDYYIQVSKNGGAWVTYADGQSTARAFTTPQLTASSTYTFRVFTKNSRGTGPSSAVSDSVTTSRVTPSAVTSLTGAGTDTTTLSWGLPADTGYTTLSDYIIQVSKNGGAWTTYPDGKSTARTFTIPKLSAGSYGFRVFAVNSRGTGPGAVFNR